MHEKTVDLNELSKYCKLTKATCCYFAEAAAVCLVSAGHNRSADLRIEGDFAGDIQITWGRVDPSVDASWKNLNEAIEYAAYAIAIICIFELTPYQIVRQSVNGTGFDYLLGEKIGEKNQDNGIIEISGILKGSKSRINQRIKEKRKQIKRLPDSNSIALILISEISRPLVKMIKL